MVATLKHKKIYTVLIIGIIVRLISSFIFVHPFDHFNILAIVKSVADTGSMLDGFFVLKQNLGLEIQLYGKIYYQIAAVWLHILNYLHVIDLRYLFDIEGYNPSRPYMSVFLEWSPYLYQIIATKIIQFLFDFILLYYLVRTVISINGGEKEILYTIFFWAINPFIVFTGYTLYQADLAMVACMVAAVYYVLELSKKSPSNRYALRTAMIFFLTLGAVIKQVPLLMALPFFIIINKKKIDYFFDLGCFILFYFFISQSWSGDMILIKHFFMNSEESLALFRFNLNSIPVFMFIYICLLCAVYLYKNVLQEKPYALIAFIIILLSVVYISEDSAYLFVQFNIWILPFLAVLVLRYPFYGVFFLAPFIGFYKRCLADNDILIGSLGTTFGEPLHYVPSYNELLSEFTSPTIVYYGMNTLIAFLYILMIITLILHFYKHSMFKKLENIFSYINLKKISIVFAIVYLFILIFDISLRSRLVLLNKNDYKTTSEIKITKKPTTFHVKNPDKRAITALDGGIIRKNTSDNDFVIITITDTNTKQVLLNQKIHDYYFSNHENKTSIVYLKKTISAQNIQIDISKERGRNEIVIPIGKEKVTAKRNYLSPGETNIYKNPIEVTQGNYKTNIRLRGVYTPRDMAASMMQHLRFKPSFFTLYFTGIAILGLFAFILHFLCQKKQNLSTFENLKSK